jgi:hypothetical protein
LIDIALLDTLHNRLCTIVMIIADEVWENKKKLTKSAAGSSQR